MSDIYASKTIILDRGNYTQCTVNLFGANITSWRIRNIEQLFLSTQAILDGKMAIRGGIPIVFPQYGSWKFGPQHGFARLMEWKVKKYPTKLPNNDIEAIVYLESDYYSKSMWNYSFRLEYQIILQEVEIKLNVTIYNTDKEALYVHILMHPYIRVPNLKNCKIVGLESQFYDKTTDQNVSEGIPIFKIFNFTDRVYKNTRNTHILTNVMNNKKIKIEKENCPDTVIWNPGEHNVKKYTDMGDQEYINMICLAAGFAAQYLKILPNESATSKMTMKIMREDIFADISAQEEKYRTDRGNYTQCTINLFGANITSWRIKNIEQLFVSTQAILDGKIAIRGGIPIVFPQYGPWKFGPQHGFARLMEWKVKKPPTKLENNDVEAVIYLESDYYSKSMWNYSFCVEYQIILREVDIKLNLTIHNTDKIALNVHILMHPYIRVPNIKNCKVLGLEAEFYDKTTDQVAEGIPILTICEYTDRVYKNTRNIHILTNVMNNKKMRIEKDNCPDTVMWNPGSQKKYIDIGEQEYVNMICLAAGYATEHLEILPNESASTKMTMKLMREDLFNDLYQMY